MFLDTGFTPNYNLIIIGNGFDLAHGLKTRYNDFIDDVKTNTSKYKIMNTIKKSALGNQTIYSSLPLVSNKKTFFIKLLNDFTEKNWYDIEKEYYEFIKKDSQKTEPALRRIKNINLCFDETKQTLAKYLEEQDILGNKVNFYSIFFKELCKKSDDTLIVNFNYTSTIERFYSEEIEHAKLIHIHGKLNDDKNPMIFGFAADEVQTNELLDLDEPSYLENIKRYLYKRTNNENIIEEYLSQDTNVNVYIVGHSCGISDKLILSTILNHKSVNSITILYYKDFNNFRDTETNIHRITRNNKTIAKINIFDENKRMIQFNE